MHIKLVLSVLGLLLLQVPPHQPAEVTASVYTPKIIHSIKVPIPAELPALELAAYPVAAPDSYSNTYEYGNCTWYVASRVHIPETWGNANTWAARASQDGYTVSSEPIAGAVAQSSAGYYGHVAIVVAASDGMVLVSEMNVFGLGVTDEAWYPVERFNYIYI